MSETYVPRPGDRVRFYSWAAQMDLFGEVLSVAPQARMATVREDNEDGETFLKSWDVLRLDQPSGYAMVTRLRDERDEAIQRAEKAADRVQELYARLASSADEWSRAVQRNGKRYEDEKARADQWKARALRNSFERKEQADRANSAETELKTLREGLRAAGADPTQIQNLQAVHNLRDHQWREERARAQQAEARIEELEDQNRVLKSERETVAENAVRWQEHARKVSATLAGHQAETWTDHDGAVRPLGAISRADLARQLYDENERAGREKARADKAEAELASLKSALKTLSN